jgi:hypothetical protein
MYCKHIGTAERYKTLLPVMENMASMALFCERDHKMRLCNVRHHKVSSEG